MASNLVRLLSVGMLVLAVLLSAGCGKTQQPQRVRGIDIHTLPVKRRAPRPRFAPVRPIPPSVERGPLR